MNKMLKILTVMSVAMALLTPMLSVSAATPITTDYTMNGGNSAVKNVGDITGLGNTDPREIAATIINIALGFLGVLAVIIILIGGFKWMTAAGNEEQIEEAKKVLMAGIIGLVIILSSWGIATFVINSLMKSTTGIS